MDFKRQFTAMQMQKVIHRLSQKKKKKWPLHCLKLSGTNVSVSNAWSSKSCISCTLVRKS